MSRTFRKKPYENLIEKQFFSKINFLNIFDNNTNHYPQSLAPLSPKFILKDKKTLALEKSQENNHNFNLVKKSFIKQKNKNLRQDSRIKLNSFTKTNESNEFCDIIYTYPKDIQYLIN